MSHVVIIGCGVVGAAIAYELSQISGLSVTVLDKQQPAQASTGAALGVLMGVISRKLKGNAWKMRQSSIQRYETLIPELEALTGRQIPFNKQGIIMLCFEGEDLANWEKLVEIRSSQGWNLEIWDAAKLQSNCPQLSKDKILGAIYSPQDRQLDPTALTLALVDGAERNGVNFKFGVTVLENELTRNGVCQQIQTTSGKLDCDWLIIAAGLGSTPLTASLKEPIDIKPVLGQALHLRLAQPLGNPDFQPVITGDDVHIVPCGPGEYWVGATVEFPPDAGDVVASGAMLEKVLEDALVFCPPLSAATIIRTWSGLRPRPEGRPAPIIGHLPGYSNVLLATGHYRNGVLLAPATAIAIRELILFNS
ncbi:FAD-binding oxidoreductase [Funiculus sociatus GB2-A5]|uniref:FAD-binding oxidoreductase n=1 Tax=Funiculus sociatus GB2-A5 TaxID=2933946 RepID=A0ABV0JJ16_9CYAN|nr:MULTISPECIES: FAD-dependent oxidoreductase [unclassified Trichocoleus]MBD1907323.1 FAD-binding oxidoreductase [Trichocoleus sp. FACHB-832]MBD2062559.1 FAD-binding oxidoreductase [Trichocoleus sp. FACHB-6]